MAGQSSNTQQIPPGADGGLRGELAWVGDLGELGFRKVKMSRDEWLRLPPKPKSEWARGWAIIMAPQANLHSVAQANLAAILWRDLPNAEVAVEYWIRLPHRDAVPDVAVMREPSASGKVDTNVPVVAIEVLSPSTWRNDLVEKSEDYLEAGVAQYWLVDYEVKSVVIKRNIGSGWQTVMMLNSANKKADIQVSDLGIVHLDIDEVFA